MLLKSLRDSYEHSLFKSYLAIFYGALFLIFLGFASEGESIEMVMPGDNVTMKIELISPIAIENGMRLAIREGGRTVGSGLVTKIVK